MAKPAVYVVRSTLNPTVQVPASRAEYERLVELNVLEALDEVFVPADEIVIQTTAPVAPTVGLIWFNPNVPA